MSADSDNLITKLRLALAAQGQAPAPSFDGISGVQAPSPDQLNILQQLQQRQAANDVAPPTPGPYGYLHDATTRGFSQLGSQFGGAISGPAQAPALSQPSQAKNAAIAAAHAQYAQDISAGVPPEQAKLSALTKLAQSGIDVSEQLTKAAEDVAKSKQAAATLDSTTTGTKKAAQETELAPKADARAQATADRETAQNTWQTIGGNAEYAIQQNGLGEKRSVKISDKASLPKSAEDLSNEDALAKRVANYEIPESSAYGRGTTMSDKARFQAKIAENNPSYDGQQYAVSQKTYNAFANGNLGDQSRFASNVAVHAQALKEAHAALNTGNLQLANDIAQRVGAATGDPSITSYNVLQGIVAKEGVKALVPGAGTGGERNEEAENFKGKLSQGQIESAADQLIGSVGVQRNALKRQYEQITKRKNFDELYPFPSTGKTDAPAAAPTGAPIEGATGTSKSGKPIVFKGGQWVFG